MTPNILDPVTKKAESIEKNESGVRSRISGEKSRDEPSSLIDSKEQQSHSPVSSPEEKPPFNPQIRWPDLIAQVFIHAGSLYGLYYLITLKAKLYTYIWCKLLALTARSR